MPFQSPATGKPVTALTSRPGRQAAAVVAVRVEEEEEEAAAGPGCGRLLSSAQAFWRPVRARCGAGLDDTSGFDHFDTPVVADGKVLVGDQDHLQIYGLLPS
jgi:hypothetical protein